MEQAAMQALNSTGVTTAWIDVSVPIYDGMVHWPDDPAIQIKAIIDVDRGDVATVSSLEMGTHTGTHIDAPRHFIAGGAGVDAVPLDHLIGPARIIEINEPGTEALGGLRNDSVGSLGRDL